jgi:stage II sporulation protein D
VRAAPVIAAAFAGLVLAAPAHGASSLVIRGAGYGHGVGMSQYGTLGYARHGWTHDRILAHYYTGTRLGRLSSSQTVRVLLRSGRARYAVTGAASANGLKLDPSKTYLVTSGGKGEVIRNAAGKTLGTATPPMRLTPRSGGVLTLGGPADNGLSGGSYRGALEFRPGVGGLLAVNAVPLEQYVAGVISAEVPARWPDQALRAQAVAARTYAITTSAGGGAFNQYADTRSQMYRGVSAETPSTSAAVRATANLVVTYGGKPVTTYFFSTSGGRTENVENVFMGGRPKPWLKSVKDPYDDISPSHRWGPIKLSISSATAKLRGLLPGRLRWIRVLKRGVSPRIVRAQLVGSGGTATATGPQLRRALGLRDSWINFTTFSTDLTKRKTNNLAPSPPGLGNDPLTGGSARAASAQVNVSGEIHPARRGSWAQVQRLVAGRWVLAVDVQIGKGGRYSTRVPAGGRYRVRYAGSEGPEVGAPAPGPGRASALGR